MNVEKSTQELILSALLKNSYLYSVCKSQITDGHFSDPSCKVIYKALTSYYNKYGNLPNTNELLIKIDECYYSTVGVTITTVKETFSRILEYDEPDEEFIKDKITDFIRKVNSSAVLRRFVEKCNTNPNLEGDEVVADLINAMDVQLSTNKVFLSSASNSSKETNKLLSILSLISKHF